VVLQTATINSNETEIKDQIKLSCIKIHNNELNTKFYPTTMHENKQINSHFVIRSVHESIWLTKLLGHGYKN